jgi:hypothetical protein
MRIEIAIAGPAEALSALRTMLEPFGPTLEQVREGETRILLFSDHEILDDRLTTITRLASKLEKTLDVEGTFEFHVRNLAYCEPPPFRVVLGSDQGN